MMDQREHRRTLKAQYGEFFDQVAAILFRHDPEGINFDTNTDEYEPEAGTIIPRLPSCGTEDDVLRVQQEEFATWFGPGPSQPLLHFELPAKDIWEAWLRYRSDHGLA
jgi:hypothetical protein